MRSWWLAVVATVVLTGCAANRSSDVPSTWRMVGGDADGEPLDLSDSPFTLVIEDGFARGETPCNSYSYPIEIDGSEISFGPGEQTAVGCLGRQGALERLYLMSLGPNARYTVDGTTLTLRASGAVWVFEADT